MTSVVLIGMPAAGKSTVGVLLAKRLGLDFVDTDLAIQVREGRSLTAILETDGCLRLRVIDAELLRRLDARGKVVATGGSAVYDAAAMARLAAFGPIVFLEVPLETLRARIGSFAVRGIAAPPGTTLDALAAERIPLYLRYADIVVDADLPSVDAVVARTCELLTSWHRRPGGSMS